MAVRERSIARGLREVRLEHGHFPGLTLQWAYRQESFVRRDNLTPVALIDYDLAVRSLEPE